MRSSPGKRSDPRSPEDLKPLGTRVPQPDGAASNEVDQCSLGALTADKQSVIIFSEFDDGLNAAPAVVVCTKSEKFLTNCVNGLKETKSFALVAPRIPLAVYDLDTHQHDRRLSRYLIEDVLDDYFGDRYLLHITLDFMFLFVGDDGSLDIFDTKLPAVNNLYRQLEIIEEGFERQRSESENISDNPEANANTILEEWLVSKGVNPSKRRDLIAKFEIEVAAVVSRAAVGPHVPHEDALGSSKMAPIDRTAFAAVSYAHTWTSQNEISPSAHILKYFEPFFSRGLSIEDINELQPSLVRAYKREIVRNTRKRIKALTRPHKLPADAPWRPSPSIRRVADLSADELAQRRVEQNRRKARSRSKNRQPS